MSTVNVIMHLPAFYKLTCMDKFMYMQACLAISSIICMHVLHVITLKHCHIVAMGIRSAFVETLTSEHFCRNAIDGVL